MTQKPVSMEELSAYVDGELAPGQAARIARIAASDPETARRVAILRSLRAGVAAIGEETARVDVEAIRGRMVRRRNARWLGAATAAAAVLALGLGLAGWQSMTPASPERGAAAGGVVSGDVARMVAAHDAWVAGAAPPAAAPPPDRLSALIGATGLRLVRSGRLPLADGRAAGQTDYLGAHGCRLSLFRAEDAAPRPARERLVVEIEGDLRLASWSAGRDYHLVSRGMDVPRFATIASALMAATRREGGDEGEPLALLSGAHRPCLG
ncbi:hypothetical protein [Amaricoccus solimangrovi]|uniref:Anti-sigma factor n=1 Tax=Amaricoccus solimangrovi TaxID=2589815 RepID=A0A501WYD4_9RHOB|nr:hypothetical protein [Amaricoccus solimangrovi]TPE50946.1 hypothetical protein FJM51_09855 [Amaricoccus solimangrovi]